MRKEVRRRHDAHARANHVCTEHSALFDATPGGRKTRTALDTYVAQVDRLLALQSQWIQDGRVATEQCRLSRRAVRDAVKVIVRVGSLVSLDEATATEAMGATMRLPGPMSDDELLAHARALLERVLPHADAFVAEGLPPDLLTDLANQIQALSAARDEQTACRQRFTCAAESIRETLNRADKTIGALEAIAIVTPTAHSEVLLKLRMAKRVGPRATEPAAGDRWLRAV